MGVSPATIVPPTNSTLPKKSAGSLPLPGASPLSATIRRAASMAWAMRPPPGSAGSQVPEGVSRTRTIGLTSRAAEKTTSPRSAASGESSTSTRSARITGSRSGSPFRVRLTSVSTAPKSGQMRISGAAPIDTS